jgi:ABC-type cobalamin/Fe3+-siderophores transport system ATPase subunit
LFDQRSNFNIVFGSCFKNNEYIYSAEEHNNNVENVFDIISKDRQETLKFRKNHSSRDAIYKLFDDYFSLSYTITQRDDDILRMSPGKRGLVLLQLILHLSNAEHPILIDQPEDNLDNRTIYNELNEFIKVKKSQRQIIYVTHNANMTVATDAENVIVANQSGQDQGKDNREFKFEYVTGGLEYTFLNDGADAILYKMGIREHVCDILEGGKDAFKNREKKYGFDS